MFWRQVVADADALDHDKSPDERQNMQDFRFRGSWSGRERNVLYYNRGPDSFVELGHLLGVDLLEDGRAAAPIDFDGDGDLDLVLMGLKSAQLLENRCPPRRFARIRLDPPRPGTIVKLTAGGVTQQDYVKVTMGFSTQVLSDLHFGLGDSETIDKLVIVRADGKEETYTDLPSNRVILVKDGKTRAVDLPRWSGEKAEHPGQTQGSFHEDNHTLGQHEYLNGNHEGAAKHFLEAIRIRPDFAMSHFELGRTRGMQGRHEEALTHLRRALELDPSFERAHWNLGIACYKTRRHSTAILHFRKALDLRPDRAATWHVLGQVQAESGNVTAALDSMKKAVKLDPADADIHCDIGKIHLALGSRDKAVEALREALRLNPKHREANGIMRKLFRR